LNDALNAAALAAGSNTPVGLRSNLRLHRCRQCGAGFIAHAAARLCSADCRKLAGKTSALKARATRTETRQRRRESLAVICRQCGVPIEGASRSTRAYCSEKCRQAAYRARRSA
jgi:hypothetical protein